MTSAHSVSTTAVVFAALTLGVATSASHIPGHGDGDPTFLMPIPGPEFFSGGIIFITLIGPLADTQITSTTFDITYVSDGTTPASNLLMEMTATVDGASVEVQVTGADLGFGSGPGTFKGRFQTDAFNGVVSPTIFEQSIVNLGIGATTGGIEGTGYFLDSFVTFDVIPPKQTTPADLNGDGVVNTLDLGILLSAWSIPTRAPGCGGAQPCAADLNDDGYVNSLDLGILLANWTL